MRLSGLQAGAGVRGFCNPTLNAGDNDDSNDSSSSQLKLVRPGSGDQRRAAFNPYDLITDTAAPDTVPIMTTHATAAADDDNDGEYLKPFSQYYWRVNDCTVKYANEY